MLHPAHPEDSVPPRTRVIRFDLAPRALVMLAGLVAGVWVLGRLAPVLFVLVGALMLVGALNPFVGWLERHGFRRVLAIAVVFISALGLLGLGITCTVPPLVEQLSSLIQHEPEIRTRLVGYLDSSPLTAALGDGLRTVQYSELLKNSQETLLTISARVVKIVGYALATVFLGFYIMIDRDRLRGALFTLVPRKHHIRFSRVLLNLETIVGGYIRGQVIACLSIAAFIFVLLLICRVPNALAIAVFGGAMDVLPYIGPFLTMTPAVLAAYVVSPAVALTVFLVMLLYEEFESRVLVPMVYGRTLRLPSSVVLFSLLAGATLGGILGALLALPMAAAALMLLEELRVDLPGEAEQAKDIEARRKDEREERKYVERMETVPAVVASAIAVEIAREQKEVADGKRTKTEAKKNGREARPEKTDPLQKANGT